MTADGATSHHIDARVPDPPTELLVVFTDPAHAAIAEAYWRIGYAAGLDRPRTWRDDIPAEVRILDDFELHSSKEG